MISLKVQYKEKNKKQQKISTDEEIIYADREIRCIIISMSKVSSSQNLRGKGSNTSRSSSDEEQVPIRENRGENWLTQQIKILKNKQKPISFIVLIILMGIILFVYVNRQFERFDGVEFNFHVFCPMSYEKAIPDALKDEIPFLDRLYVVSIQENITTDHSSQSYYYCGLARQWTGSCEEAKHICSRPGPVLDFEANEEVIVVWRNEIEKIQKNMTGSPGSLNACYNSNGKKPQRCYPYKKSKNWEQCTYKDPTLLNGPSDNDFQIGLQNIPISTHIHGLEVRPTFDGNPLSWYSHRGKGVGYFSAEQKYFGVAESKILQAIQRAYQLHTKHSYKINVYKNTQLPGSLWYHDHAMGTTGFNVNKGLSGMYLIRTNETESVLPNKTFSKILLINREVGEQGRPQRVYVMNEQQVLKANATYRFKVLNSDYSALYSDLRFVYECVHTTNLQDCTIPLTVIGADSALRKYPVKNVKTFRLASAERVDLLIQFPESKIPYHVYLYDFSRNLTFATMKISGNDCTQNYTIPESLPVSFQNLTEINQYTKKRMRPILLYPEKEGGAFFSINGHVNFHHGQSENPQIGTVEDWYYINLIGNPHPIHVHLINFQMIKQYSLKMVTGSVTYYHCDFYLQYANFDKKCDPNSTMQAYQKKYQNGKDLTYEDYQKVAAFVGRVMMDQATSCFANYANEQNFKDNVSGIDLHRKCSNASCNNENKTCSSSFASSRYICDDTSSQIYDYERGWKEVALVQGYTALVTRIRWAKTDYDSTKDEEYFHEDEQKLIEFPGYVYHCHFLSHEDHEMMRPIMMQPSEKYKGKNWNQTYQSINEDMGCNPQNRGDLRR